MKQFMKNNWWEYVVAILMIVLFWTLVDYVSGVYYSKDYPNVVWLQYEKLETGGLPNHELEKPIDQNLYIDYEETARGFYVYKERNSDLINIGEVYKASKYWYEKDSFMLALVRDERYVKCFIGSEIQLSELGKLGLANVESLSNGEVTVTSGGVVSQVKVKDGDMVEISEFKELDGFRVYGNMLYAHK